jgi:hypothetical protein
MTRRWVRRILYHERREGRVVPTGRPAEELLSPKQAARRWYALQGWPAHRIEERLARDFPPPDHNGRRRR